MESEMQEVKLSDVLHYFGKGFEPRPGLSIFRVDIVAVDPARDTVVYRIYTKDERPHAEQETP